MFDVLIAGAGPAGTVAATVLARAGARVLVLDRAKFPRSKLCGDTVNPGALAVLHRLRIGHVVANGLPIEGMIVTGEGGVQVVGRYGTAQGRSISRRELDAALVRAAVDAGARVEEGVLVREPVVDTTGAPTVTGVAIKGRDGRTLRLTARVVIAADGSGSRLSRALGLSGAALHPRRWAVGAYFTRVEGITAFGEMHVRRNYYLGVAPLPGGVANACVVTSDRALLARPRELLVNTLRCDPAVRGRFAAAEMVAEPACLGPLAIEARAAGFSGLLLAGDAAGFIDPMTGDGLRFALRGGELAAAEALHAMEDGDADDAHRRLDRARRAEFAPKWRFNRALRALVGSPTALRAAGAGARLAPAVFHRIIAYAGDVQAA